MSLPTTAPAAHAASSTDARQVSTESGTSKRACSASTAGTTRSSSSSSSTSGPGPAFTPPTSSRSAPSTTSCSAATDERVEIPGRAPVVERVGRAVEDAHHHDAARARRAALTQPQRRERRDGGHGGRLPTPPRLRIETRPSAPRPSIRERDRRAHLRRRDVIHVTSSAVGCCSSGPSGGATPATADAKKP